MIIIPEKKGTVTKLFRIQYDKKKFIQNSFNKYNVITPILNKYIYQYQVLFIAKYVIIIINKQQYIKYFNELSKGIMKDKKIHFY
jgi:hypothetical protein